MEKRPLFEKKIWNEIENIEDIEKLKDMIHEHYERDEWSGDILIQMNNSLNSQEGGNSSQP